MQRARRRPACRSSRDRRRGRPRRPVVILSLTSSIASWFLALRGLDRFHAGVAQTGHELRPVGIRAPEPVCRSSTRDRESSEGSPLRPAHSRCLPPRSSCCRRPSSGSVAVDGSFSCGIFRKSSLCAREDDVRTGEQDAAHHLIQVAVRAVARRRCGGRGLRSRRLGSRAAPAPATAATAAPVTNNAAAAHTSLPHMPPHEGPSAEARRILASGRLPDRA